MSRSSVSEWACVPAGPADTQYASTPNARTPTGILHTLYAALLRLHKIQISSLNGSFHPTLLFSISPPVFPLSVIPRARIYIGGSDIVEVIEKLSCRRVVRGACPHSNPSCHLAAQEEYQTGDPGGKKAETRMVEGERERERMDTEDVSTAKNYKG